MKVYDSSRGESHESRIWSGETREQRIFYGAKKISRSCVGVKTPTYH